MGLFVRAEGGESSLASNTGWSDFGAWAETLDPGEYGPVVQLWEYGCCDDAADLAGRLDAALDARPPENHDVIATAEGLAAFARRAGASWLEVTDGMGPEDGEDDEDPDAWDDDGTEPEGEDEGDEDDEG